jgi:arylsulfatase A-like enzyme
MLSPTLALLLGAALGCYSGVSGAASAPNLVLVLTDDMGLHSPGFINPEVRTPAIDALAAEGVAASMYSYKFCSPTRAAFLTGRFPWRVSSTLCTGGVCNYLPAHIPMGVHTGFSMIPKRLQEAGYIS